MLSNLDGDVKIKIIMKDKPKILANANITILTTSYGYITIKGFIIWKSPNFNERLQENLNITPPLRKGKVGWVELAFFERLEDWINLEQKIYSAYIEKRAGQIIKQSEEVDPKDIPNDF